MDGVGPCAPWLQGCAPLLVAARMGYSEVMRELIAAKADQTAMDGGSTPTELLLRCTAFEQGNVAHALAVSTADVNTRNAVRRHEAGVMVQGWRRVA